MSELNFAPAPVIGAHNHLDAEIICAAQILYRDGILSQISMAELNARIGRQPGAVDLTRGSWRLLFENGYTRLEINALPDLDRVSSFDDWKAELDVLGGLVDDEDSLRSTYPLLAEMQAHLLALKADAGPQWRHEQRQPSLDDVNRLLDDGWALMVHLGGGNGWSCAGLVLARSGGGYVTYDSGNYTGTRGPDVFEESGSIRSVEGWRR